MGPRPTATVDESAKAPETFPNVVITAIFRPHAIARAMMKRTEGPGAKIITIAAMRYSGTRDGMITGERYPRDEKERSGRDLLARFFRTSQYEVLDEITSYDTEIYSADVPRLMAIERSTR